MSDNIEARGYVTADSGRPRINATAPPREPWVMFTEGYQVANLKM